MECPECHKKTLKKQVSAPSFQLTGSGWYVTDFKNKVKESSAKADTKTETKKDASASSTSS
jgi:predicted nucleic acid-binding Zn ribbon protein